MQIKLEKGQQLSNEQFTAVMANAHKRTRHPLFTPTAKTMELAQLNSHFCGYLAPHVQLAMTLQTECVIKSNPKAAELQICDIENQYRYFAKRLNYAFYKKGYKRSPDLHSLLMLPTLEGRGFSPDGDKTLHYHVAVGNLPAGLDLMRFKTLVRQLWVGTHYVKDDVVITPADEGWIEYITKELRGGNIACIDWPNATIPYDALDFRSQ